MVALLLSWYTAQIRFFSLFFFQSHANHPDLHSFPTRRSADLMGPMPYTAIQSLLDPLWTAGAQNYFTGAMLSGLADETIDTLLARHACGRAPVRELHLHHCGGAMARVPAAATAFAHRNAK